MGFGDEWIMNFGFWWWRSDELWV